MPEIDPLILSDKIRAPKPRPATDKLTHLTAIRDARRAITDAQQRSYNRTYKAKRTNDLAISDEAMDMSLIAFNEAIIALAQAEIALLDAAQ